MYSAKLPLGVEEGEKRDVQVKKLRERGRCLCKLRFQNHPPFALKNDEVRLCVAPPVSIFEVNPRPSRMIQPASR